MNDINREFDHGAAVDWHSKEAIADQLYDHRTYAAAGQNQLSFFLVPQGDGQSIFAGAGTPKTYEDTNMESAGQMNRGEAFLVQAIALRFTSGVSIVQDDITAAAPVAVNSPANDEQTFWNNGYLEFTVVNKVQTRLPISNFPPPTRLSMEAAFSSFYTQAAAGDGTIQTHAAHVVPVGQLFQPQAPGVTLEYGLKFKLTLNWSAAVAMPSNQDGRVQAMLIGRRLRIGQ